MRASLRCRSSPSCGAPGERVARMGWQQAPWTGQRSPTVQQRIQEGQDHGGSKHWTSHAAWLCSLQCTPPHISWFTSVGPRPDLVEGGEVLARALEGGAHTAARNFKHPGGWVIARPGTHDFKRAGRGQERGWHARRMVGRVAVRLEGCCDDF